MIPLITTSIKPLGIQFLTQLSYKDTKIQEDYITLKHGQNDWALLSSWLPSIPNPTLDNQAIEEMVFLEGVFYLAILENVGIESFLGAMNTKHHGEMIFDTKDRPPVLIKTFLEYADRITNISGRWEGILSTTTKLLHFMCPQLFPIFDEKISKIVFGNKQTYARYHC